MVCSSTKEQEITRFHGIDRHYTYSTITVMDREGTQVRYIKRCEDLPGYLSSLRPHDAVAFEVGNCAFFHVDIARGV
jgi:hypothetical protein